MMSQNESTGNIVSHMDQSYSRMVCVAVMKTYLIPSAKCLFDIEIENLSNIYVMKTLYTFQYLAHRVNKVKPATVKVYMEQMLSNTNQLVGWVCFFTYRKPFCFNEELMKLFGDTDAVQEAKALSPFIITSQLDWVNCAIAPYTNRGYHKDSDEWKDIISLPLTHRRSSARADYTFLFNRVAAKIHESVSPFMVSNYINSLKAKVYLQEGVRLHNEFLVGAVYLHEEAHDAEFLFRIACCEEIWTQNSRILVVDSVESNRASNILFRQACHSSKWEEVNHLLSRNPSIATHRDNLGQSPLDIVCLAKHKKHTVRIVKTLIENGADVTIALGRISELRNKLINADILQELIKAGANVNRLIPGAMKSFTPLDLLCMRTGIRKNKCIADLLLEAGAVHSTQFIESSVPISNGFPSSFEQIVSSRKTMVSVISCFQSHEESHIYYLPEDLIRSLYSYLFKPPVGPWWYH